MLLRALIVLLFGSCVLAVLEYKVAQRLGGYPTSYFQDNTTAYANLFDNNDDTWFATANEYQPQINVMFDKFYFLDAIEIVNRKDFAWRIVPFWIYWGLDILPTRMDPFTFVPGKWHNLKYIETQQAVYRIPAAHYPVAHFKLTQNSFEFLNIAGLRFLEYPKATITSVAASSVYPGNVAPLTLGYDNNITTVMHSDNEYWTNPWFELRFAATNICKVAVWNRNEDCCNARLANNRVSAKLGEYSVREQNLDLANNYCNNEPGITCTAAQTDVKEVYIHDFPSEPYVDRVRVFQINPGWMNIAEVIVYPCSFPATPSPNAAPRSENNTIYN